MDDLSILLLRSRLLSHWVELIGLAILRLRGRVLFHWVEPNRSCHSAGSLCRAPGTGRGGRGIRDSRKNANE